jgi:hypothetical protein
MLLQYKLELTRDAADQIAYEESANYGDAFLLIGIGVVLLMFALIGTRLGADDLPRRKLLAGSFLSGLCLCFLSVVNFARSAVVLDREKQVLTIRRSFWGVGWTHLYRIEEIDRFFQGVGRSNSKRLLALEFTNGRTKALTLWETRTSLAAQEARLNDTLKRFRRYASHQTGKVPKPVTEEMRWALIRENAAVDLRKHSRRTLYALIGGLTTATGVVSFLKGNPLHRYWSDLSLPLFLASMGLWLLVIFEALLTWTDWANLRDWNEIDKPYRKKKK